MVFATENRRLPALAFSLFWLGSPRRDRQSLRLFCRLYAPPFVRSVTEVSSRRPESQSKAVWRAKLCVTGSALLGKLNKSESNGFPNSWSDGVTMNAISLKIVE